MKTKLAWALAALFALLSLYLWQKSGCNGGDCCRKHQVAGLEFRSLPGAQVLAEQHGPTFPPDPWDGKSAASAPILKAQWCQMCGCGCKLCLTTCGGPGFPGCRFKSQFRSGTRNPNCPLAKTAK